MCKRHLFDNYYIQPVEISADVLSVVHNIHTGIDVIDNVLQSQGLLSEINVYEPRMYMIYCLDDIVGVTIIGESGQSVDDVLLQTLEIELLAIDEKHQRKGVGSYVLNHIVQKVMAESYENFEYIKVLALDIKGGYSAVDFYKNFGFDKIYRYDNADEYLMLLCVVEEE